MVLESLAIVLRAKGGSNFLVHARGVDAKDAAECSREVAGILAKFADAGGKSDTDRGGDNAPSYNFGEMLLASGRHRVVYRLVGGVYLMVVASAQANVLWLLGLMDACVQVLIGVARSVEVTPDKLARRYPELYLALSAVLASGGRQPMTALQEADAELASLVPDTSKSKGALMGRLGRSGSSSRAKASGSSGSATLAQREAVAGGAESIGKRTLADEVDDLAKVSFKLPPDVLRPAADAQRAQSAAAARAHDSAPQQAGSAAATEDPFKAKAQDADRAALAGTGLEGLFDPAPTGPSEPATAARDPFGGALGMQAADFEPQGTDGPASDNPWASFDDGPEAGSGASSTLQQPVAQPGTGATAWQGWNGSQPATSAALPGHLEAAAASAMAVPSPQASTPAKAEPDMPEEPPRDMTDEDEDLIGSGNAVELLEVWQGLFRGDRLVKAGLLGQVLGSAQLAHASAEARFKCYLFRKSAMSQRLILRGLHSAVLSHAEMGEAADTYKASFAAAPKDQQVPLLRYRLPAMACTPPVLASLVRQSSSKGVLLTCHILVSPSMPGSLEAVSISMLLPAVSKVPVKVAPRAQWLAQERELQWDFAELCSGSELMLRVLLPAGADTQSAQDARVVMQFNGPADETLTGLTLESGPVHGRLVDSRSRLRGRATAVLE